MDDDDGRDADGSLNGELIDNARRLVSLPPAPRLTPETVLGQVLRPHVQPTGIALLALAVERLPVPLFLGLFWYRTLDWKRLVKITMDTIETTATVLFIVAAASIFGWLLTVTRVTDEVAAWVLSFTSNPHVFLLLANLR